MAAVLLAWFPGQEFGHALADVLLGVVEPGGRLPTGWPSAERGLPATRPVDGMLRYDEGLAIGYRDSRQSPRYPFGHGLGYTSWRYASIDWKPGPSPGLELRVNVCLCNIGPRTGREVVQVYASRPESSIERPHRWLAGFATVDAEPGEHVTATVAIGARAFEHWDVEAGQWTVEPGTFRLAAGPSSALLPLATEFTISGPAR
jgi:beta-glucosidase